VSTKEDLEKTLDQLKARAALPALSPEDEELARIRAEIAKHKAKVDANEKRARQAREDAIFEDLETKHAGTDLERVDTEGGMIVMRPPSIAKARHFQQIALKGKLGVDAIEDFVKPTVVYPDEETLEGMLERYPLLTPTLCSFAQEMGSAAAARRGKA
jgi:hypothetical protein